MRESKDILLCFATLQGANLDLIFKIPYQVNFCTTKNLENSNNTSTMSDVALIDRFLFCCWFLLKYNFMVIQDLTGTPTLHLIHFSNLTSKDTIQQVLEARDGLCRLCFPPRGALNTDGEERTVTRVHTNRFQNKTQLNFVFVLFFSKASGNCSFNIKSAALWKWHLVMLIMSPSQTAVGRKRKKSNFSGDSTFWKIAPEGRRANQPLGAVGVSKLPHLKEKKTDKQKNTLIKSGEN